ncbi:DUF1285 domain-containing protein [Sphingobium nicotianae]|uniref:DUF1285 domain-containing protein n=1 Tax=Sphingobium nicotianae TaxID=2782607 RepID=A0A9X1DEL7_9SPHN|nr:DUF1285 domain-containing protein [Sphingobium nicotianae]MBT2188777.1 DUF1285 domain-containing protein [Sphingobium nicotianae]
MIDPPPDPTPGPIIAGLPADRGGAARYPVEQWHPDRCGHSGMRIDAEGRWYHEGRPILRPALVSLFARLLRREADGRHVLVTPVEMLDIDVDDAPLIAIEMGSEGMGEARALRFRIGATGLWEMADAAHAIVVEAGAHGPRPYLMLDAGLRARIARPVYYALAELAIEEGHDPPGLWSGGAFHALEPQETVAP